MQELTIARTSSLPLERALSRERIRSGIQAAAARGRIAGNPGIRVGDPAARRKIAEARRRASLG